MPNNNKATPYIAGEELKQGELVFVGADGKLYKMNPLLMTKPAKNLKEPARPEAKKVPLKEKKARKASKVVSTAEGTFLTERTLQARKDRQALLQGQGAGQSNDDWLMGDDDDDAKKKALLKQRPQVVVNGGFDPKQLAPKKAKKKADDDDDL